MTASPTASDSGGGGPRGPGRGLTAENPVVRGSSERHQASGRRRDVPPSSVPPSACSAGLPRSPVRMSTSCRTPPPIPIEGGDCVHGHAGCRGRSNRRRTMRGVPSPGTSRMSTPSSHLRSVLRLPLHVISRPGNRANPRFPGALPQGRPCVSPCWTGSAKLWGHGPPWLLSHGKHHRRIRGHGVYAEP